MLDFAGATVLGDSDLQDALRFPPVGRASCDVLFPVSHPALTFDRPIFALPHFRAGLTVDPPSAALQAPGARMAPRHDSREMGAEGRVERALAPTDCQAQELNTRRILADGTHVRRMEVRLGPTG